MKAHTTKIGLLVINMPFTPSAVTKVLRELTGTCLPAMMSAVQICEQEKAVWGSMMGKEVHLRVRRVFKEMETLLLEVQDLTKAHSEGRTADKPSSRTGRDSLSSTGVVWESCDAVVELEKLGIAGLAVQKAEQYRDTIKDAIEELREWGEGDDTDNEGIQDALLDSDDEAVDGDHDSIEDMFNAANSLPKDREDLRLLLERALKKLPKVRVLCDAIVKRRLKSFSVDKSEKDLEVLDALMDLLRRLPHQVDELASGLYDLDEPLAAAQLDRCCENAVKADELVLKGWDGKDDGFTEWSGKWREVMAGD